MKEKPPCSTNPLYFYTLIKAMIFGIFLVALWYPSVLLIMTYTSKGTKVPTMAKWGSQLAHEAMEEDSQACSFIRICC